MQNLRHRLSTLKRLLRLPLLKIRKSPGTDPQINAVRAVDAAVADRSQKLLK
jgi:hypothetical protein